jgi:hypothetical protein
MPESYPLALSLLDFVPNLAFLAGAYFLVALVLRERGRRCGRMAMAGSLLVFLGGFLKAVWKTLYTLNVADVQFLSQVQFVLLAPGLLALLVTVILLARQRKPEAGRAAGTGAPVAAMAAWKIPFLAVMTLCSLGAQGILTYVAFRRGQKLAAACSIAAFLGLFAMGGMASAEQTTVQQWIEEIVNSLGQLSFMAGSILLYRQSRSRQATC